MADYQNREEGRKGGKHPEWRCRASPFSGTDQEHDRSHVHANFGWKKKTRPNDIRLNKSECKQVLHILCPRYSNLGTKVEEPTKNRKTLKKSFFCSEIAATDVKVIPGESPLTNPGALLQHQHEVQ